MCKYERCIRTRGYEEPKPTCVRCHYNINNEKILNALIKIFNLNTGFQNTNNVMFELIFIHLSFQVRSSSQK